MMKTIGLIGGMSWESTLEYYRVLNETTKARLGGLHSARCVLYSVDFAEVEALQHQGRWDEAGEVMARAAKSLELAGADFIILCTNTMHKLADNIENAVSIPFLHIAEATAGAVKDAGVRRVGLLGTRFTMEQDFYTGVLLRAGLEVLVPEEADREIVHRVIYNELCLGRVREESRREYVRIIRRMLESGAGGIILGCTEIELLVRPGDVEAKLFPTARLHAEAAVDCALR